MTPQTVNAYYSSTKNRDRVPAAILQPPFFHPDADPASTTAASAGSSGTRSCTASTIRAESRTRRALRDWWTAEDAAKFKVQADRLGAQYSTYEPLPGVKVNGALTMGENIADLGGLTLALEAYQLS
jgi:putative endopeptidase